MQNRLKICFVIRHISIDNLIESKGKYWETWKRNSIVSVSSFRHSKTLTKFQELSNRGSLLFYAHVHVDASWFATSFGQECGHLSVIWVS